MTVVNVAVVRVQVVAGREFDSVALAGTAAATTAIVAVVIADAAAIVGGAGAEKIIRRCFHIGNFQSRNDIHIIILLLLGAH